MNATWYLQSHRVCVKVPYVCIVCRFVDSERFTIDSLRNNSRSSKTAGVSLAEPEDFLWIDIAELISLASRSLSGII